MAKAKTGLTLAFFGMTLMLSLALMVMMAQSLAAKDEVKVDEAGLEVARNGDQFLLKIPVENLSHRVIRANLFIQLLDFDDQTLWQAERDLTLFWKHRLYTVPLKVAREDLYPNRLRYRLDSPAGVSVGIVSVSEAMSQLETHVLGQTEFLAGGKASIRIVTLNHRGRTPIQGARVKIEMGARELFRGKTNEQGTLEASFFIPEQLEGQAQLTITASSPIGEDVIERQVKVSRRDLIYLITDKPLYQPNQVMHIRALSLRKPSLKPASNWPIIFEVEDSKGNKVYKKRLQTDRFGLSSVDFQLADEVNLGRYKVRAILGDSKSEKTVTVKRYVLPKFDIEFTTDKQYYLPGEKVQGEIQANYFFDKPVAGGLVEMSLSKFDVGFSEVAKVDGVTDEKGHFEFQLQLPEHFVGQPLEQGDAFVKFEVSVSDQAKHQETLTQTRTVSKDPIRIVVIPESGEVVPYVSNLFYVMTTYPDGSPAKASVTMNGLQGETDDLGIAQFHITPREQDGIEARTSAVDEKGNRGELAVRFEYDSSLPHLLLRTDQALYEVGDQLRIDVLTTKTQGMAYLDVVRDGQTMLTKSLEVQHGAGSLEIDLTADLTGPTIFRSPLGRINRSTVQERRVGWTSRSPMEQAVLFWPLWG